MKKGKKKCNLQLAGVALLAGMALAVLKKCKLGKEKVLGTLTFDLAVFQCHIIIV